MIVKKTALDVEVMLAHVSHDVLTDAWQRTSGQLDVSDLLSAILGHAPADVCSDLSSALRPGARRVDLDAALCTSCGPAMEQVGSSIGELSLSAEVVEVLEEFSEQVRLLGSVGDDVKMPLLLDCLLRRLVDDRQVNAVLDVEMAASLMRERAICAAIESQRADDCGSDSARSMHQDGVGQTGTENSNAFIPPEIAYSTDLTGLAEATGMKGVSPFAGVGQYEALFDRVVRSLHRRAGGHVLLVAERGVGPVTLLAEFARRGVSGEIFWLSRRRVVSVDCRYVAPEESRERLAGVLAYVAGRKELVVCFDGLAKLLRTGRGGTNKPMLLSQLVHARCRVIGILTPREYEELVADDVDMREFFTPIEVDEPNVETSKKLLTHFAAGLAEQYQVSINSEAIDRAVILSANYIFIERLPGKALKILHRICEDIDYERSLNRNGNSSVTADHVIAAVSETSGVPEETLRGIAERTDYEASLRQVIVGQNHAIGEVATELGLIKAGLTEADKPASVMLFVGQTGTGKTELAKALARIYSTSKRLKTYTLGNFAEAHSIAGIIGVPPGYVGHDSGGRITSDLAADPYSVFLLDEADKAHPDVLQPFLNLFDEGWVVDQRGVKAYGNHAIFILTTNVGQKMIADMAAKGNSPDEIATRIKETLSQLKHPKAQRPVFAPEFLARIKRVIVFNPLDSDAMHGIARIQFAQMQQTWHTKRNKTLFIPDPLIGHIATLAHDKNQKSKGKEGGRIVRKLISDLVESRLQRAISNKPDEYQRCNTVELRFDDSSDENRNPQIGVHFSESMTSTPGD